MTYVMSANREVEISGVIDAAASEKYQGSYLNQTIQLEEDFLQFEHTDGLNAATFDVEHHLPIASFGKGKIKTEMNLGGGGIWVIPKNKTKIYGISN